MTLTKIIEKETKRRHEDGMYGITACKEFIKMETKRTGKSLYTLLGEYVESANHDVFFNQAMVLACWELINEH